MQVHGFVFISCLQLHGFEFTASRIQLRGFVFTVNYTASCLQLHAGALLRVYSYTASCLQLIPQMVPIYIPYKILIEKGHRNDGKL